jgi:hypothetical protein
MPTTRVRLRAEQEGRAFEWLVSPGLAEQLAEGLREKGWTVSIRPRSEQQDPKHPEED